MSTAAYSRQEISGLNTLTEQTQEMTNYLYVLVVTIFLQVLEYMSEEPLSYVLKYFPLFFIQLDVAFNYLQVTTLQFISKLPIYLIN